MKKLILIFGLLIWQFNVFATHMAGADMRYEHMGGNQYKIIVVVYRDCEGTNNGLSNLDLYRNSSCANGTCTNVGLLNLVSVTPIDYGCGNTCNNNSGLPGFEKHIFEKIITLPNQCSDWKFFFKVGNRNTTDYASSGYYKNTLLINNENNIINNSPHYLNESVFLGCVNSSSNFINSYTDDEGDLVIFSLTAPLSGSQNCSSSAVTYQDSNLSFQNPFPSVGNVFNVNSTTGNINFTPTLQGTSYFALLASEYRDGVLISQSIRDGEIIVINCQQELGIGNWNSNNSSVLIVERYDNNCFQFPISTQSTIINNVNITGLPNGMTESISGLGTTNIMVDICLDYEILENSCDDIIFSFIANASANGVGCVFDGLSDTKEFNIILKGNTYCQEFAYYTNIDYTDPNNPKIIPLYTKASNTIWVGNDMPTDYNDLLNGPPGDVLWNQEITMEAGVEVIFPACVTGSNCVTITGGNNKTFIIKPNNCNVDCPRDTLNVKIAPSFECNNEQITALVLDGEPPYTYIWNVEGNVSNNAVVNVNEYVSESDIPINYTIDIYDAVGNFYTESGQVLGTANLYRPLSTSGVVFKPNGTDATSWAGWYYTGVRIASEGDPFFIADGASDYPQWYGAHTISFQIWDSDGHYVLDKEWSIVGSSDWSINNGEVYWNGHENNNYAEPCATLLRDLYNYRIVARNCMSPGSPDNLLTTDPDNPPEGLHIEQSSILTPGICYAEDDNYYDAIVDSHSQTIIVNEVENSQINNLVNYSQGDNSFEIYPNPTNSFFKINGDITSLNNVSVYNMAGDIIYSSNKVNDIIYISDFENGIYLVKLDTKSGIFYRKLVKQ